MEDPLSEELFASEGREDLLQRCRDAIAGLQQDLETERLLRQQAEGLTDELQREVANLQDQLHSFKVQDYSRLLESQQHDTAFEHAKKQLSAYKEQLARSAQEQSDLQTQTEDLKGELLKAKRLLEEAREELARSKAAVTEWSAALTAVESKLKALTKENKSLKEASASAKQENDEIQQICQSQKDQIQRLQAALRATEEELAAGRKQMRTEEEGRRLAQQKYLESFNLQAEQYQEAMAEVRKGQFAVEKELEDAKRDLNRLKDRLSASTDSLEATKSTLSTSEQDKTRLQSEISTLKASFEEQNQTNQRLRSELDTSRSESTSLREQIDTCQTRIEGAGYKAAQLEQTLDRVRKELALTRGERDEALQQGLRQKAEWEDKVRAAKEQHRKDVQNLLEENKFKLEAALRDYETEFEKELNAREEAESAHSQELQSLQAACSQSLQAKDDEMSRLDQDRERLREAVMELESKLVLLSRTVEERAASEQRRDRKAKARLSQDNEAIREKLASLQSQLVQESELFKSESRRKDEEIAQVKRQAEERVARRTAAITEQADLRVLDMKERCLKELALLSKLLTSVELEGRSGSGRLGDYLKDVIDRLEQGQDSQ